MTTSYSEEDRNYLRMVRLLNDVAPKSVRAYFDQIFPPSNLAADLQGHFNTLHPLRFYQKVLTVSQWNILFPPAPAPVTSEDFDITLMICLLRNITGITPPVSGYDTLPNPTDVSTGDDLARIKHYRNYIAHSTDAKLSKSRFDDLWNELSQAVERLGGLVFKQMCNDLKSANLDNTDEKVETLEKRILKTEKILEDLVPKRIRALKNTICRWEKEDEMYVETNMSKSLLKILQKENCITVIGSSGIGKSVTVRHVALQMLAQGYDILLIKHPDDILTYTVNDKQILYVIDDFCGKYNIVHGEVEHWNRCTEGLEIIMAESKLKILSCCRLQVYQNWHFKCLNMFTKHPFNINSEAHGLTIAEKRLIAQKYIPDSCSTGLSDDQIRIYDCFPLLCRMVSNTEESRILDFLLNPFDVFQTEINNMFQQYDKMDYCAVMMLILFDNHLSINLLVEEIDSETREKFDDLFETLGEKRGTSRYRLKDHLDSLIGTYISLQDDVYRFAHDKIYDMVYSCCRADMVWCLLKHSSVTSLSARMGCDWMTEIIQEFSIIIPAEKKIIYLERFIKELTPGNILDVFGSKQMNDEGFRQTLLHYLQNLGNDAIWKVLNLSHIGTNILHLMCKLGHHDVLTFCLNNRFRVNICDIVGNTPLHIACTYSHNKIVDKLLDTSANVNAYKHRGFTPLFAACMSGNVDIVIVKKLLFKGADPNWCGPRKLLPLLIACQNGQHEIAELLLQHGADPNATDYQGETALHLSCSNNHEKCIRLLITFKANIDATTKLNETPLYYACDKQNISIVKILVSEKADILKTSKKTQLSPIILMIRKSRHDIAILMLQFVGFATILDMIIEQCENIELLNFIILNSPIDLKSWLLRGDTILHKASDKGFFEIAQSMIDKGADVNQYNSEGKTAIQLATLQSHKDIVDLLIQNGADVNTAHPNCALPLPLHIACLQNDIDMVQKLIKGNADVNNKEKLTVIAVFKLNSTNFMYEDYHQGVKFWKNSILPIEITCFDQNLDITNLLLKAGAKTDLESNFTIDPILIACFYENKDILELLLTHNANVNKCCDIEILCKLHIRCSLEDLKKHSNADYGISPLHFACMHNNEDIVDIFIQHGANILLKCNVNPCVFAVLKGKRQISAKYFNCEAIADMYPLHIACFVGNHKILVKLITESKVLNIESRIKLTTQQIVLLQNEFPSFTPDTCEEISLTPLQISCLCGHWDTCRILIEKGADIFNTFIFSEIICSIFNGEKDLGLRASENSRLQETNTIDFILERKPDFDVVDTMFENISHNVYGIRNIRKLFLNVCFKGDEEKLNRIYEEYSRFLQSTMNINDISEVTSLTNKALINSKTDNNETPLHFAVKSGDEKTTEYLIQKGADIFCFNKYGETALHLACKANSLKLVIILLKSTAANLHYLLYSMTICNETPLYLAYLHKNLDMVKTLIGYGADINLPCGKQNASLLFYACETGQIQLVDFLLSHSACTNMHNNDRKTPLYVSCEAGYDDVTEKLLQHGADVNIVSYQGYGPLYFACTRGNSVIVERILVLGADPNILSEKCVSLLIESCIAGDIRVANCLLQHGADVNFCHYEGETALYFAFNKRDTTMMRSLLDYGAAKQVCSHERELYLFEAYKNGMLDIARFISEYDDSIDVNAKLLIINTIPDVLRTFETMVNIQTLHQNTIFHQICLRCSTNYIENILCTERVSQENIETECVYACLEGKLDVFHLFIDYCRVKGYFVNLNTCMILAAGNNKLEIVKAILDMEYDVNEQNELGYTALHAASAENHVDIVQTLLNCPLIDVNAKTTDGYTPLHLCCVNGHVSIARILLNNSSTIHAETRKGQTIIDLACINKHNNMLEFVYKRNEFEILNLFERDLSRYLNLYYSEMKDTLSKWLCRFQTVHCIDNIDTVIHFACRKQNDCLVENLIKGHVNVNSVNLCGETPLLIAISAKHTSIVTKLLEAGAKTNYAANIHGSGVQNLFGKTIIEKVVNITALHIACLVDNYEIVSLLLDRHADCGAKFSIHYKSVDGKELYEEMTPLYISTLQKNVSITIRLIQNTYSRHSKPIYMYSSAIHRTSLFNVNDNSTDIKISMTPFQVACLLSCDAIVKAFIDYGCVDINEMFVVTPRMLSVAVGQYDAYGHFLQENKQTDDHFGTKLTPLIYSCLIQNASMVDLLLQHGAKVKCTVKMSLLHLLAIRRDILENLCPLPTTSILTSDCTVNAISLAFLIMDVDIVKLLLSYDMDWSTIGSFSIFHILALRGCAERLNTVLENGITENLYFSAQDFHVEIMCTGDDDEIYDDEEDIIEIDDISDRLKYSNPTLNTLRLSYIQLACFLPDFEVFKCILTCSERNARIELTPFFLSFFFNHKKLLTQSILLPRLTSVLSIKFISWYLCFKNNQMEKPFHIPDIIVNDMSVAHELHDTCFALRLTHTVDESSAPYFGFLIKCKILDYNILSFALFRKDFPTLSELLLTDVSSDSVPISWNDMLCLRNIKPSIRYTPLEEIALTPLDLYYLIHFEVPDIFYETSEAKHMKCNLSAATIACLNGNEGGLKIIASQNCKLNTNINLSLLHISCFYVEERISYETITKFNDICEMNVLHAACLKGYDNPVIHQIKNHCDVNAMASLSPLHICLLINKTNMKDGLPIKITREKPKQCQVTAVHILCFQGNESLLKLLSVSTCKFDMFARNISTLHFAFLSENSNVHLTEENYNATSQLTPLQIGCITNNTAIVKILLQKTDSFDLVGSVFPHHISFKFSNFISRCITDRSVFKLTAFHIACLKQNQDSADALIRAGTNLQLSALLTIELCYNNDIYLTTKSKLKPLHIACLVQNMPIARMIISETTQINEMCPISVYHVCYFRDEFQSSGCLLCIAKFNEATLLISPLHISCLCGNKAGVKMLLQANADANLLAHLNPAYALIYSDAEEIFEIYLQSNVSVKKSPLHICAEKGDYEICELLVKHGAYTNIGTNIGGFQPWHLALYHGHIDALRCLLMTPLRIHRGQFLFVFSLYIIRKRWSFYILSTILKMKSSILLLLLYRQFLIVFGFIKKKRCKEVDSNSAYSELNESEDAFDRNVNKKKSELLENSDANAYNMTESEGSDSVYYPEYG